MRLWNIGSKTSGLMKDVGFFEGLGGSVLAVEDVTVGTRKAKYALLAFGETKVFLSPAPAFEAQIGNQLPFGLTHAVFAVPNLSASLHLAGLCGAEVLIGPSRVVGAFGDRDIAFVRTPGGTILELAELHTDPLSV